MDGIGGHGGLLRVCGPVLTAAQVVRPPGWEGLRVGSRGVGRVALGHPLGPADPPKAKIAGQAHPGWPACMREAPCTRGWAAGLTAPGLSGYTHRRGPGVTILPFLKRCLFIHAFPSVKVNDSLLWARHQHGGFQGKPAEPRSSVSFPLKPVNCDTACF